MRPRWTAALICALATGGGIVLTSQAWAGSSTWTPSAPQLSRALATAQAEAWSTSPAAKAAPGSTPQAVKAVMSGLPALAASDVSTPNAWPTDTQTVVYRAATRAAAEKLIDGVAAPDDRNVIVARLVGMFSVVTTAPNENGGLASGTVMTVAIDPDTGQVLDFGLESTSAAAPPMPGSTPVFSR